MAECSGASTVILNQDFSTGYTEGGFAGINMKARSTAGPTGAWAARSEGTQAQIDGGWLGSAFGIQPGFTASAVPAGIIEFDLLPHTPYVSPGGGASLIGFYYGLVYIAALGHRFGTSGDQFSFDSVWQGPIPGSASGLNPQTATWRHIEFAYQASSLTLDGSVWVPNADGFISVWVDGVEVYNAENVILSGADDWPSNSHRPWSNLKIGAAGTIANLVVTQCDAIAEPEPLPPPNPTPCDCTPGDPGDPDDEIPPEPGPIIPPVLLLCAGGGLVPTATDYVSPETWWGQ